jgi:hypothetical protein
MFWPNVKKYEQVYSGITISEFKDKHPKAISEYLGSDITIYSITYYDTEKKFVNSLEDAKYKKFYYFENNKLVKVDKGERTTGYRIRIDTNKKNYYLINQNR